MINVTDINMILPRNMQETVMRNNENKKHEYDLSRIMKYMGLDVTEVT